MLRLGRLLHAPRPWRQELPQASPRPSVTPCFPPPSACLPCLPACLPRIYFNAQGGKPGIKGRSVAVTHAEFPAAWFEVGGAGVGAWRGVAGGVHGWFAKQRAAGSAPTPAPWGAAQHPCWHPSLPHCLTTLQGLPKKQYAARIYTVGTNKYGVKAGQDQAFWVRCVGQGRGLPTPQPSLRCWGEAGAGRAAA